MILRCRGHQLPTLAYTYASDWYQRVGEPLNLGSCMAELEVRQFRVATDWLDDANDFLAPCLIGRRKRFFRIQKAWTGERATTGYPLGFGT